MQTYLLSLVLLLNGLSAGVLVGTLLGGVPLLYSLPDREYVTAHAFFAGRYDPFMPACLLATLVGDVVLAGFGDPTAAKFLWVLAALAALGTVVISVAKNVPINRWVRTLDPDELPGDFSARDPRYRWGHWNRVRSGLAVLALLLNTAALPVLLTT